MKSSEPGLRGELPATSAKLFSHQELLPSGLERSDKIVDLETSSEPGLRGELPATSAEGLSG